MKRVFRGLLLFCFTDIRPQAWIYQESPSMCLADMCIVCICSSAIVRPQQMKAIAMSIAHGKEEMLSLFSLLLLSPFFIVKL